MGIEWRICTGLQKEIERHEDVERAFVHARFKPVLTDGIRIYKLNLTTCRSSLYKSNQVFERSV